MVDDDGEGLDSYFVVWIADLELDILAVGASFNGNMNKKQNVWTRGVDLVRLLETRRIK